MKADLDFILEAPITSNSAADWHRIEKPAAAIVRCPDCGSMRRDMGGPHAPRVEGNRRLDCVGREVLR